MWISGIIIDSNLRRAEWKDSKQTPFFSLGGNVMISGQVRTFLLSGEGIGFHIDTHSSFVGGICILSLGSCTVMEFRKIMPGNLREIQLPANSKFGRIELFGIEDSSLMKKEDLVTILEKIEKNSTEGIMGNVTSNIKAGEQSHHSEDYLTEQPNSSPLLCSTPQRKTSAKTGSIYTRGGGVIASRLLMVLHPNSACCFDDEFRFAYQHGIPSRSTDQIDGVVQQRSRRISITFRTMRPLSQEGCNCLWPLWCDTQNKDCHQTPTRLGKSDC